jgi:protein TonB
LKNLFLAAGPAENEDRKTTTWLLLTGEGFGICPAGEEVYPPEAPLDALHAARKDEVLLTSMGPRGHFCEPSRKFWMSLLGAILFHGVLFGLFIFTRPWLESKETPVNPPQIIAVSLTTLLSSPSDGHPAPLKAAPEKFKAPLRERASLPAVVPEPEPGARVEEQPAASPEFREEKPAAGRSRTVQFHQGASSSGPFINSGPGNPSTTPEVGPGGETRTTSRPGKRTETGSAMAIPRYGQNQSPVYPFMAREQGWQGTSLLRVLVLKNGSVGKTEIVTSSGFTILDQAALRGISGWKFAPGKKDGQPIDMWVQIPISFRLE